MNILNFNYVKPNGEKTNRDVLTLNKNENWIEGIDLSKLTEEEIVDLKDIQKEYESKINTYYKKGFRRFLTENMDLGEDTGE